MPIYDDLDTFKNHVKNFYIAGIVTDYKTELKKYGSATFVMLSIPSTVSDRPNTNGGTHLVIAYIINSGSDMILLAINHGREVWTSSCQGGNYFNWTLI